MICGEIFLNVKIESPIIKNLLKLLVMAALLFLILLILGNMRSHKQLVDATTARNSGMPIPVASYIVDKDVLKPSIVGSCIAEASRVISLVSSIRDPIINRVFAKQGDLIEAGFKLIQLDDRTEKTLLKRATKRVYWLQKKLDERKHLMDYFHQNLNNGHSLEVEYRRAKVDWVLASADMAQALEDLELAKIQLTKTHIVSPFTGVLDNVISEGQVARQDIDLAGISVLDPMHIKCNFDVADYAYVKSMINKGVVSFRGGQETLSANFIKNEITQDGRNLDWVFSVENENNNIYPAMKSYIKFQSEKMITRVPTVSLLNSQDGNAQVFIISDESIAVLSEVRLGLHSGGFTEIIAGLYEGDRVVVVGQKNLSDGEVVSNIDPLEVTYPYGS